MADTDTHIIRRQAEALLALCLAAMPEAKGGSIDRSPAEPLHEYEIPYVSVFTGKDVTLDPNESKARRLSGVIVRWSHFDICITERASTDGAKRLFGHSLAIEKSLFKQGETLGGLVERIERAGAETVAVLEGSMETHQRFISLQTRGLGIDSEPGYGTADVYNLAEAQGY